MDTLNSVDFMTSTEIFGSYPTTNNANAAFSQAAHLSNAQKTTTTSGKVAESFTNDGYAMIHSAMTHG